MATRVVEWKKPYTWWEAIDIDQNKVISLKLRDENNLIIYDSWDDEIYVDLQLPDWITPTDAFPVWVTTGRVVVADWWDKAGTIICAKTTSGDNIKLLYADDWTLWIDNGTGTFKQIYFKADVDALLLALRNYIDWELAKKQNWVASATAPSNQVQWDLWYDTTNSVMKVYDGAQWINVWYDSNVKVFNITSSSDLTTAQAAYDWYKEGNIPIVIYSGWLYLFGGSASNRIQFNKIWPEIHNWTDVSWFLYSNIWLNKTWDTITWISAHSTTKANSRKFLEVWINYSSPYTPEYNWSPATKKYVDDSVTVVSDDSWVTYHITVSNSDPASWTANNIITLVP